MFYRRKMIILYHVDFIQQFHFYLLPAEVKSLFITRKDDLMNLRLIVCDDSELQLNEANAIITHHLNATHHANCVFQTSACQPDELKKRLATGTFEYDIAVLDIEMGDMNGIDIASEINAACPYCAIIFLTNYTDYISESYEVRHIYYVTKDSMQTYLPKALEKAIRLSIDRKTKSLEIISNRKHYLLPCDAILYLERLNREVFIHLSDTLSLYTDDSGESEDSQIYKVYDSLQSLHQRLPLSFSKCHSAFIVNLGFIKTVTSQEVELINGTKLPIGRRYVKNFKSDYLAYITEHHML